MNAKNTIFVNLPHPNAIPIPEARLRQWKTAAVGIAADLTPTLNPEPAVASTEEPTKMSPEPHQNRRLLNGIKATLKISGKWLAAPSVFSKYYNKYDHANVSDIEIGLDILAKTDEVQAKVVDGEKQYHLPTSDFETLLNRCQVSRYHLAGITGIDKAVMCGYCKGAKINAADAQMIADKLNIELSELEGITPTLNPKPETPTIEQLFEIALPRHIEGSRWGRYIVTGPASRVFNGTIFQYHAPCSNFWDLYELSKGIFRDLGIRLSKFPNGVWVAHIPIRALTDTVFVERGLAGVERTLLAHTGIDPAQILREIRKRQFQETQIDNAVSSESLLPAFRRADHRRFCRQAFAVATRRPW